MDHRAVRSGTDHRSVLHRIELETGNVAPICDRGPGYFWIILKKVLVSDSVKFPQKLVWGAGRGTGLVARSTQFEVTRLMQN